MKKYQDRMEASYESGPVALGRHDPTPWPFAWHIREEVHADGTKTEVSRRKIYDSIL